MYLPDHFRDVDAVEITELIAPHPLACVVAQSSSGLIAKHLPLLQGKGDVVIGHVALGNDMHRMIAKGQEAGVQAVDNA